MRRISINIIILQSIIILSSCQYIQKQNDILQVDNSNTDISNEISGYAYEPPERIVLEPTLPMPEKPVILTELEGRKDTCTKDVHYKIKKAGLEEIKLPSNKKYIIYPYLFKNVKGYNVQYPKYFGEIIIDSEHNVNFNNTKDFVGLHDLKALVEKKQIPLTFNFNKTMYIVKDCDYYISAIAKYIQSWGYEIATEIKEDKEY